MKTPRIGRVLAGVASLVALLTAGMVFFPNHALAANGDFVHQTNFSTACGSGIGVGVGFDGTHLWYSCYASNPDLFEADALTGAVITSFNVNGGLGALSWDSTRQKMWAGWGGGGGSDGDVRLIDTSNGSSTVVFNASAAAFDGLDDGFAFDAQDDSLYVSPDTSTTIYHYTSAGALMGSFPWAGNACYNSGLAIGGQLLFQGSDGCNHIWVVKKSDLSPQFDFGTGVNGVRDEGMQCDNVTFAPKTVMWSMEAYEPRRAVAFEIPSGSCTFGGGGGPKKATITSTTQLQVFAQGGNAALSSTLTDPSSGTGIAGKSVTMTLGSGAGSQSCSATTNASGVASCTITPVTVGLGPQPITDSFAGDADYLPASNTQSALIYAGASNGAFTIGDKTAASAQSSGASVTWWGAQWAKANSLSGGAAPAAFKGFEDASALPVCGGTWTTDPGNSTPPPKSVPSYLAIIVVSHVGQSGSAITGDVVHLVIVKTDPGYQGDPGHAGTGVIVAAIC